MTDPDAPGYTVMGPRGSLEFWVDRSGKAQARDAYGTGWSWRGDLETLLLDVSDGEVSSSEYPNAFERIAGALDARQSGEIWVTTQPGCDFEAPGGDAHVGGASHGALHALDSFSPVVIANAPRRLPHAMRSIDIASLALEALGLQPRYAVGEPRLARNQSSVPL
jgi:hypothetical protein